MIVGFSGRAGAGKSTAANFLTSYRNFRRVRFAGPIKSMLRALLPGDDVKEWVDGVLKDTVHPAIGHTPRFLLQTLGTEWGRKCLGEDFWVNLAREDIAQGGDVVIDDVRFQNEVDMIRSLGGIIIQVRPRFILHAPANHVSEAGCDYDHTLYNDGTIEDLNHNLALMLMSR